MHGHMNGKPHLSLTSDLCGGWVVISVPGKLTPRNEPRYPLNVRLGGHRSCSWSFGGE